MRRLALLGASGHGKVVADAALASGWDSVEFFDDAWPQRSRNGLWPVTGDSAALMARLPEFQGVLVSIGDCAVRWEKHQALLAADAPLVTVVHPAATVSRHATLGLGTVVMAGAVVNIDALVGQAVIVNTGATVDHDCQLGDAVHI
ncbi:MAG: acetyltransferase, partial [Hylemonella sp.]